MTWTAVWIGVGLLAFGAAVYVVCGAVCVAVGRGRRDEDDTSWGQKITTEGEK